MSSLDAVGEVFGEPLSCGVLAGSDEGFDGGGGEVGRPDPSSGAAEVVEGECDGGVCVVGSVGGEVDAREGCRGGGQDDAGVELGGTRGVRQVLAGGGGVPPLVKGEQAEDEEGLGGEVTDLGVEVDGALCALGEPFPVAIGPGQEDVGGFGEALEVGDVVAFQDFVRLGEVIAGGGWVAERGGGVGEVDAGAGELDFLGGRRGGAGEGRCRVPGFRVAGEHQDGGPVDGDGGALDRVRDARDECFGALQPSQVLGQGPSLDGGEGDRGHGAGGEFGCGVGEVVGGPGDLVHAGESETSLVAHQGTEVETQFTANGPWGIVLADDAAQGGEGGAVGHRGQGGAAQFDAQPDPGGGGGVVAQRREVVAGGGAGVALGFGAVASGFGVAQVGLGAARLLVVVGDLGERRWRDVGEHSFGRAQVQRAAFELADGFVGCLAGQRVAEVEGPAGSGVQDAVVERHRDGPMGVLVAQAGDVGEEVDGEGPGRDGSSGDDVTGLFREEGQTFQ
ncbi:hypothetical protein DEJ45_04630 [Streptomyces venezuelae]|nr:hypothetical protein DEJ45_04630 [Streptomyces venezuelae]